MATWNADVSLVALQTALVGEVRDRLLMLLAAVGDPLIALRQG